MFFPKENIELSLAFLIAWLVYGLTPAGDLAIIYVGATIYSLAVATYHKRA